MHNKFLEELLHQSNKSDMSSDIDIQDFKVEAGNTNRN